MITKEVTPQETLQQIIDTAKLCVEPSNLHSGVFLCVDNKSGVLHMYMCNMSHDELLDVLSATYEHFADSEDDEETLQ